MDILLSLIALIMFSISVSSVIWMLKKPKKNKEFSKQILAIAISSLITGKALFLSQFLNVNFPNKVLILAISVLIVIQTISLISIISEIQQNKKIKYSILLLLIAAIPILFNNNYVHVLIPASLLITIMTFLTYTEDHKSHISLLIIYASVSIIFYIVSFLNQNLITLFSIISISMFLIFYVEFLKFLSKPYLIKVSAKNNSPLIPFLKHLVFVIIITNFVFIGTISVHELGHVASVKSSNCEDVKIVYDLKTLPHTEVKCDNTSSRNNWIMAGIFLPLIVALLLMFGGGKSIKEIGLEIIGFNLVLSFSDFQALGFSKIISVDIMIAGIIMTATGLILLTNSRTNHL